MDPRWGWVLLGLLAPGWPLLMLSPVGPYGAWAAVAAALGLLRGLPHLRPALPAAAASLAAGVAFLMLGSGVTVGTPERALASVGDDAFGPLAMAAFFLVAAGPAAILMTRSTLGGVRLLGRAALVPLALLLAVAVGMVAWPPDPLDGSASQARSVMAMLVIVGFVPVLLGFALPAARLAWERLRGAPPAPA